MASLNFKEKDILNEMIDYFIDNASPSLEQEVLLQSMRLRLITDLKRNTIDEIMLAVYGIKPGPGHATRDHSKKIILGNREICYPFSNHGEPPF